MKLILVCYLPFQNIGCNVMAYNGCQNTWDTYKNYIPQDS